MGLLGLYAFSIFPSRGLISEFHQLRNAQLTLSQLNRQNNVLAQKVKNYSDPSFVAKIAHSSFDMVLPGQTSYLVMPGSPLYAPPSSLGTQGPK